MQNKRQDRSLFNYQRRPLADFGPVCILFVLSQTHTVMLWPASAKICLLIQLCLCLNTGNLTDGGQIEEKGAHWPPTCITEMSYAYMK